MKFDIQDWQIKFGIGSRTLKDEGEWKEDEIDFQPKGRRTFKDYAEVMGEMVFEFLIVNFVYLMDWLDNGGKIVLTNLEYNHGKGCGATLPDAHKSPFNAQRCTFSSPCPECLKKYPPKFLGVQVIK